jgi:tungstate transport system ATP-binding protein
MDEKNTARAAAGTLLRVDDLCYESGSQRLLDHASFSLGAGLRTVVLGANGAGKSVLLRLLHGLLQPTSGRVSWAEAQGRALRQAMVFQRPVLLRRSAMANVIFALKLGRVAASACETRALTALSHAGLMHIARRSARVLSGGEQQRLALARAWALEPDVLLLDEPTANLDPTATREVEDTIMRIHAGGARIVMTTHNLGQARRLADDIVFVHQGRVTEHTPASTFFAGPKSAEAVAFMQGEIP